MNQQYPIASSLALRNNHHLHVVNNNSSSLLSAAAINENTSRQHKNNGPASPHHLDELAATSILLIRNSNNTSLSFQQQQHANNMHKVQLTDNEDGTTENVDVEQQQHDSSVTVHVPPSNSTNATGQPPVPATVDNVTSSSTTNQQSSRSITTIASPVYHDYAQEEDPTEKLNRDYAGHSSLIAHEDETTRSLANQKLPAKLAAMLSDPDLITCITWLPHGRSWKILNRDIFSSYALPRYFGHTNHSSFVRVVNAWGFRRIVTGPDRDSYYHELFLRGKSGLYSRMKRLPNNNKKSKDLLSQQQSQQHQQSPRLKGVASPEQQKQLDFYELSKQSPLPENTWQYRPQAMNNGGVGSRASLGAAFGSVPTTAGGGMSGMMGGGMIPPPPPPSAIAGMGMHPQFGTGAASLYPTMGVASPMMSAAAAPMMASSGWNIPGIQGGASTATAAGMMGMQRHRQPSMSMSIDGSSTTSAAGRGGPPENSIGSSSTNRPQLLAAAAALQQQGSNENTSTATTASISSSSEIQSLMNQNQLLQALLRKTQAAVAAAGVAPGSASAGGAGYPYQYAAQPPADGGNDDMKH